MNKGLTFQDVLMIPAPFSKVESRADVDTTTTIVGNTYKVPIISSNMDTVYSPLLAIETAKAGGVSCVHRFCSIEENIKLFKNGIHHDIKPWVSIGVNPNEIERAEALLNHGAETLVIDVANAANIKVAEFYKKLNKLIGNKASVVVGNFATHEQIKAFIYHAGSINIVKIGIGMGSLCTTRVVTGAGYPGLSSLLDCTQSGLDIIYDGGGREIADFPKALAAGAKMVMMGRHFASCKESGGTKYYEGIKVVSEEQAKLIAEDPTKLAEARPFRTNTGVAIFGVEPTHTEYRGSASAASYKVQGKEANHRPVEGASTIIPISGNVADMVLKYEAALRSSLSYQNAFTLEEFRKNTEFVKITQAGQIEGQPFAKV